MKILGICGSLRKESYNLKLLANFAAFLPEQDQWEMVTLHDIPLFSEDREALAFPTSVNDLSEKILSSDALLFACPEYNYSVPGVLKNAIDWVSRHKEKPFTQKIAGIMGASPGRLGTARAQYHLRQIGVFIDLCFLNRPEIMVSEAHKKFDADGKINDAITIELLKKMAQSLTEAVKKQG